jgi:uncharacterized RDD family membrane protein YckC
MLDNVEYVGFWPRFFATIVDTVILLIIAYLLLWTYQLTGFNDKNIYFAPVSNLISWFVYPALIILLWIKKRGTPGKMAVFAEIVDAETGRNISLAQGIGRYVGYYLSFCALGLGVIWVAFDRRKQGWHDKLAGTVVIRRQ